VVGCARAERPAADDDDISLIDHGSLRGSRSRGGRERSTSA
jgi:hypothetical protein